MFSFFLHPDKHCNSPHTEHFPFGWSTFTSPAYQLKLAKLISLRLATYSYSLIKTFSLQACCIPCIFFFFWCLITTKVFTGLKFLFLLPYFSCIIVTFWLLQPVSASVGDSLPCKLHPFYNSKFDSLSLQAIHFWHCFFL